MLIISSISIRYSRNLTFISSTEIYKFYTSAICTISTIGTIVTFLTFNFSYSSIRSNTVCLLICSSHINWIRNLIVITPFSTTSCTSYSTSCGFIYSFWRIVYKAIKRRKNRITSKNSICFRSRSSIFSLETSLITSFSRTIPTSLFIFFISNKVINQIKLLCSRRNRIMPFYIGINRSSAIIIYIRTASISYECNDIIERVIVEIRFTITIFCNSLCIGNTLIFPRRNNSILICKIINVRSSKCITHVRTIIRFSCLINSLLSPQTSNFRI